MMDESETYDWNPSRCHRDKGAIDKFADRMAGSSLEWPDAQARYEVAAVSDVPCDLLGRGG
jgi:hypothetical protein